MAGVPGAKKRAGDGEVSSGRKKSHGMEGEMLLRGDAPKRRRVIESPTPSAPGNSARHLVPLVDIVPTGWWVPPFLQQAGNSRRDCRHPFLDV